MTGLSLRELDGVHLNSIASFEKHQIPAIVHDANGDMDLPLRGFRFGTADHRLHGGQVKVFFGGKFSVRAHGQKQHHGKNKLQHST